MWILLFIFRFMKLIISRSKHELHRIVIKWISSLIRTPVLLSDQEKWLVGRFGGWVKDFSWLNGSMGTVFICMLNVLTVSCKYRTSCLSVFRLSNYHGLNRTLYNPSYSCDSDKLIYIFLPPPATKICDLWGDTLHVKIWKSFRTTRSHRHIAVGRFNQTVNIDGWF